MSDYRDFISDFPSRCLELLDSEVKSSEDRSVTRLLMVLCTAFVVPYERLFKQSTQYAPAHSDGTSSAWEPAKLRLEALWAKAKEEQDFDEEWRYRQVDVLDVQSWREHKVMGDPGSARNLNMMNVADGLRHAVAHGNVRTIVADGRIESVAFIWGGRRVEKQADPFHVLVVRVNALGGFVRQWVNCLKELPGGVVETS
jgi:hypothetical protein